MEKRIWVKIDGLQLHHLQRRVPMKGKPIQDNQVWASLKLGSAFNINGLIITNKPDDTVQFWQGWGNADARLIDVPALHGKPIKKELLREVLAKAIHGICIKWKEVLRPFIEMDAEATGDELSFSFFKPKDWQGKSLMIPVDFVILKNFQLRRELKTVTADIIIGHYLAFWNIKICPLSQVARFLLSPTEYDLSDVVFGEERIQDDGVRGIINEMVILNTDIRETVNVVSNGTIDMESRFTVKVEGTDPEAIPPPIKFE